MSQQTPIKLIPRNVAALRRGQQSADGARLVAGNPVSTRLESGVGNCFPGLECDLRNLERRFFPFLEVDIQDTEITVLSVDLSGVQESASNGEMSAPAATIYRQISSGLSRGRRWTIRQMRGTFGPLGVQTLVIADLQLPSTGTNRLPPDAWTAIRLLTEGTEVQLTLRQGNTIRSLVGNRARYLNDNGELAKMFLPGELTQSLCSPWTHDFRDCGCFYWASNHPDIALPLFPTPPPVTPEINTYVPWERKNRTINTLPDPATMNTPVELSYYEINAQWQTLNFVLEGLEIVAPYQPGKFTAVKFASLAELVTNLRYAAGVELAVIHEYLAAAYSLKVAGVPAAAQDDVDAARAELMRVTYGEMRHVRAVNDVLRALDPDAFVPALGVASQVPASQPGTFRPVGPRPATPDVVQAFMDIEKPSVSVDGLYARVLATLEDLGSDEMQQTVRSIMADGESHFETFSFIQEWLDKHSPSDYLRNPNAEVAPANNALHRKLQQEYGALLERLFTGYTLGIPAGAADINTARNAMLGITGLDGAAEAVAAAGFLVAFDRIADARFAPVNHP
ncbi:MAG: ferritin-like domain-containing protein [Nitrospirota bacterium]